MTIDELRIIKDAKEMSAVDISMRSGVPVSTIYKIFQKQTTNPRKETLAAIERALGVLPEEDAGAFHEDSQYNAYNTGSSAYKADGSGDFHSEEERLDALIAASGKKQGEFTTDDLETWPEDFRVELIDGMIYDMSAPTTVHQVIVFELAVRFRQYIQEHKGKCVVMVSPVGVRIDCDKKTELQPDVSIVCNREMLKNGIVWGAPDFVCEVLSPSTGKKDLGIKMLKYKLAGVKEFWAVDPKEKYIIVYLFKNNGTGDLIHMYSFQDKIAVGISDGQCEIDFAQIDGYLDELFGSRKY